MQFIFQESTLVLVAVVETHLTIMTLIILPSATERAPINPGHRALTLSSTTFPVALICSFFNDTVLTLQTVLINHSAVAAWSAILKRSSILIAILEGNNAQTIKGLKFKKHLLVESSIHELAGNE